MFLGIFVRDFLVDAKIDPATNSRNLLIYKALISNLPILGCKWGIFDAFSLIPKIATNYSNQLATRGNTILCKEFLMNKLTYLIIYVKLFNDKYNIH